MAVSTEVSAEHLTDRDVVAAALGEPAFEQLEEAAVRRAASSESRVRTWSSPRLAFTHEQLPGGSGESSLILQQIFRLSGRHRLAAQAASLLGESERLAVRARTLNHATVVRTEFYRLLQAQERLAVTDEWLTVMHELEEELRRRVEAGESAPYERLRVQKEIADISMRADQERATLESRQIRLGRLLNRSAEQARALTAKGALMPGAPPADDVLLASIEARPDVAGADAKVRAADMLERSTKSWWVPDPQLEAGYLTASNGDEREHGFVAGISVALPFANQAKADRLEAEALRLEGVGEREYTTHHAAAEVLGLATELRALQAAAARYEEAGVTAATRVVETARFAYGAGELGILELIDGYRGLVEARLFVVEIAAHGRAIEVELWHELANSNKDDK